MLGGELRPLTEPDYRALKFINEKSSDSHVKKDRELRRIEKMWKLGAHFEQMDHETAYSLICARLSLGYFHDYFGWEYRNNWAMTFLRLGEEGKLKLWDGKKGKVFLLGEQGLGDEIMWSSIIPDLINVVGRKNLIYECDKRLIPVMSRSFKIKCTERRNLLDGHEGQVIALGDLQRFYRKHISHFPKKPYLIPDKKGRDKWLKWLKDYPKPWIGVAWKARHGEIDMIPIAQKLPGTVINLQYGEKSSFCLDPNIDARVDFDDQINLISCLDRVVSITQTVVHVAGSLGVPVEVIKDPKGYEKNNLRHPWYYHANLPWYEDVKIYENSKEWLNE